MERNVSKDQMNELPYIIAVDFDGTLVEDKFPEIGRPIEKTWELMKKAQDAGTESTFPYLPDLKPYYHP